MSDYNPVSYGKLPVGIDPTAWYGRKYNPAITLTISHIQNQLAGQINAFFGNLGLPIQSYVYPDTDYDTWWQGPEIGYVLIVYRGTRLSKPMSTDAMVQERTLEFDIVVLARTVDWALKDDKQSVYALIDSVENALTGFRPDGCRNAFFTDERFSERDPEGGVWLYEMKLEIITMRPKAPANFVLANLAKMINLIYDGSSAGQPQTIPTSNQLGVPQNHVVTAIVTKADIRAQLGIDYQYSAYTGVIQIDPQSTVLKPGVVVTVFSAPVLETLTTP